VKQVLDRIGTLIIACQDGGFVGVHRERLFVRDFLLRAEEAGHGAPIVVTAQPCVAGAKMACAQLWIFLDRIDRTHQGIDFNAVNPDAASGLISCHRFVHDDSSIDFVVAPKPVRLEQIIGAVQKIRKMYICQ